jgi:hypothetical protein
VPCAALDDQHPGIHVWCRVERVPRNTATDGRPVDLLPSPGSGRTRAGPTACRLNLHHEVGAHQTTTRLNQPSEQGARDTEGRIGHHTEWPERQSEIGRVGSHDAHVRPEPISQVRESFMMEFDGDDIRAGAH